jgi:hypothetical protein
VNSQDAPIQMTMTRELRSRPFEMDHPYLEVVVVVVVVVILLVSGNLVF